MPNSSDKKKILEDYTNEIIDEGKKIVKRDKFYSKFKRFQFLKKYLIAFGVFLIIYFIYAIIVSPPVYGDKETERNGERFKKLTDNTEDFEPLFAQTIDQLKEHPYFYKKVVNNLNRIEIKKGNFPYMMTDGYGKLGINPGSYNFYEQEKFKFTASLVHEADHVEYHKSSELRKLALKIKCSPILNPGISIDSGLASLEHRFTTIEICAQKEQIKFHNSTDSESGYEAKYGAVYGLTMTMKNIIKSIFSIRVNVITD